MMSKRNRYKKKKEIRVGNSIVVKDGVKDADFDVDMGGWQGRIIEIQKHDDGDTILLVEWDSITLDSFSDDFFENSEEEGMAWQEYYIPTTEIKITTPRDTKAETQKAIRKYSAKFAWVHLGHQGKEIQAVLEGINPGDESACFNAWYDHFDKNLSFPFDAEISEFQERGPHRAGEKVQVLALEDIEYPYGVLVKIKKDGRKYAFPLCDLEASDTNSKLHDLVENYAIWFANR